MQRLRKRTYQILDIAEPGDRISNIADVALVWLIVLNILAVILESVGSISDRFSSLFNYFELLSVAVFTVEYFLRAWSVVESSEIRFQHPIRGRIRYFISPMAIVDLAAILPFYLTLFFVIDLRFLRALRLLRMFRMSRYSNAMSLLMEVFRAQADALLSAVFILIVILIFAASGIYVVEHKAQPDAFGSIPAAMWWAVATLTTVGYGDVTPITIAGKIFGALVTVTGIGMVALPAGLLGSGFTEALRRRHEALGKKGAKGAQATSEGLGNDNATPIHTFKNCPHCGKSILPP